MLSLLVTLFIIELEFSQGLLFQVNNSLTVCPSDEAVFWCSGKEFLQWEILSEIAIPIRLFFTRVLSDPMETTLGYSSVIAGVTYSNDSFINATLTITMATNLTNLSRITVICNGDTLDLSLSTTDIKISSAYFRLQSLTSNVGIFAFHFVLSSNLPIMGTYVVNITPPPPFGPSVITSSSTAVLPLQNNIQYIFTILFQACSEKFNSTIIFGRCTFIPSSATTEVVYIIDSSGSLYASINCTEPDANETQMIECGMNGKWNKTALDICGSPTSMEISKTWTETATTVLVRTSTAAYLIPNNTPLIPVSNPSNISITILIVTVPITATGIFAVLVGVIGITVAIKLKISKKNKVLAGNEVASGSTTNPIYEELDIEDNAAAISPSKNIAYEELKKIKP